jgi:2-keto-3-deoxy-L-rhamnonate aldolase RhmA
MTVASNSAKARLQAGELAVGIGLRQARTVDIAVAMKTCGFDWLFIDLEHNAMSVDTAVQIAIAAAGVGIAPLVRIPEGRFDLAGRVLDGGALGIVVPHVETAEQAKAAVDHLKYPPIGRRSIAAPMPQLAFRGLPLGEATASVNEQLLVVAMLETSNAVRQAEAIAAVPGIDALHVGANDLSAELGVAGQYLHADVERAFTNVIAACRRHDKWPAMGGIYTEEGLAHYVRLGVRMVLAGNDLNLLMGAATQRADLVRRSARV